MKNIVFVLILCCFCSGVYASPVVPDTNQIIHVWGGNGTISGDNDNLGYSNTLPIDLNSVAKLTIAAGITAAPAGGVVIIHPKTAAGAVTYYEEDVEISKPLTLVGINRQTWIRSDGGGKDSSGPGTALNILTGSEWAKVSGIHLEGVSTSGVTTAGIGAAIAIDANHVLVEDCLLTMYQRGGSGAADECGVRVSASSEALTVRNCDIRLLRATGTDTWGVWAGHTSTLPINNILIENCSFYITSNDGNTPIINLWGIGVGGTAQIKNSRFTIKKYVSSRGGVVGIGIVSSNEKNQVSIDNCLINCIGETLSSATASPIIYGVYSVASASPTDIPIVRISNTDIMVTADANATCYGIKVDVGKLIMNNSILNMNVTGTGTSYYSIYQTGTGQAYISNSYFDEGKTYNDPKRTLMQPTTSTRRR